MPESFDLIVIGAGSAGLTAATVGQRLGARVALVEGDRIGGDCTWTGCIPSKTLLHSAKLAHQVRTGATLGVSCPSVDVDFPRVMRHVRATTERVYAWESPDALARLGIEVVLGQARFRDAHTLAAGERILQGRAFIICTGARSTAPPIPGLERVPYLTTETVFDLKHLPERLVVLGGGPTGVELGQAFQRLGAQVTIVEAAGKVLGHLDPDARAILVAALCAEGIVTRTATRITHVTPAGAALRLDTGEAALLADALLVVTGRRPRTDGLDLERAGVAATPRGVTVDEHLRTSQRHIYAAGDVTGGPQFTHYAGWQGAIAARNALLPRATRGVRRHVPWVLFTDPEIGQVGLTERATRAHPDRLRVHHWPIARIDRAQTAGEQVGLLKLITDTDGRLLGATVVAGEAGELVNELSLAIDQRLTLGDLARTIHAYPTYGLAVQQAASDAALASLSQGWRGRLLRAIVRRE